ncbi:NAD-dependent epimerase/dehydratase family protein [Sphaerisporangium sp. TRM90804]|uniref:NAD-dependent epimerase/dehydratase family protein n=1 Tax=Sphaerisporangium sp. TRM90804 TaxID=3031113 RepID=UPI00244B4CBD|nr:NAD-dependent epimerase/dehydratase family protein [Sphaerisporangium sp. TRM90804]MDH2424315.1 NAD-dependent epimerase/dehydratase family protein [Sphaerisporangium sp. TRM90804]
MRTLVIGGSVFLGHAIVEEALRRGHEVTTFNRGRSAADVPGVSPVRGDREDPAAVEALASGGEWDAVVDVCGYTPSVVALSARALSGRAATYAFVSTLNALSGWPAARVDETAPLQECSPDAGPGDGDYGVLKAGCERAVEAYFDGAALMIQPGLILGPRENVGRLPAWLRRAARGGRMLAPGDPGRPMQLIDARDIAAFTLDHAEKGTSDRFITTGPAGNTTYGDWLAECVAVTGAGAEPVWVDDRFLLDREVEPWSELPLWTPADPESAAVWDVPTGKAAAAGLRCRPVAETVRDTWAWLRDEDVEALEARLPSWRRHGIEPAKEARILAAWDAR